MLLKYLILTAVIYGIYKFSTMNKSIEKGKSNSSDQEPDNGEYVDYEEIE